MNNQKKYDLKKARRRFAVKYLFLKDGDGLIEGEPLGPVTPVAVTDTGSDPTSECLYAFVDPSMPAILVSYADCKEPGDPAKLLTFPKRFENYPVHYYSHEEYMAWLLGVKS